ncbi:NAD(P)/FAD-dependent oxidoreductase [Aliikangiella maris]|uniref:FAD-dependent oxidoreductase n=2 Tax=Aliikangiella maris TaxID=3162458 RepID=A0ABV2BY40_9GAMM
MSKFTHDVVVVGAGIIGTTIAERLQYEGKRVLLIDRSAPGEGCSKGNAGHFATDVILPLANFKTLLQVPKLLLDPLGPLAISWSYFPRLLPWLMRFAWAAMPHKSQHSIDALKQLNRPSIATFETLLARTGLTDLMSQQGALTVFSTESGRRKCLAHAALVEPHGINVQILSTEQVSAFEPALKSSISGALYFPDTAHTINPFRLVTALFAQFMAQGGNFKQDSVIGIDASQTQVTLKTTTADITAKEIIIACGAWSKDLLKTMGHNVPLETERGYHLMLSDPQVKITRPITSFEHSFVLTPMEEGLRLAGTVELAGLNAPANERRALQLLQHAQNILTNVNKNHYSTWMGHRPSLPDSLPIIGRSPKNSNVILAFGHQHLGLTQAAVTAQIISQIIHQQALSINIEPYSIKRFS